MSAHARENLLLPEITIIVIAFVRAKIIYSGVVVAGLLANPVYSMVCRAQFLGSCSWFTKKYRVSFIKKNKNNLGYHG